MPRMPQRLDSKLPPFCVCWDLVFVPLYARVLHCLLLVSGKDTRGVHWKYRIMEHSRESCEEGSDSEDSDMFDDFGAGESGEDDIDLWTFSAQNFLLQMLSLLVQLSSGFIFHYITFELFFVWGQHPAVITSSVAELELRYTVVHVAYSMNFTAIMFGTGGVASSHCWGSFLCQYRHSQDKGHCFTRHLIRSLPALNSAAEPCSDLVKIRQKAWGIISK